MKQTAVEWLYEHILLTPLDIRSINKCYEQAKEMEKEQIIYSNYNGQSIGKKLNQTDIGKWIRKAEQYYKENYEQTPPKL